VTEQYISTVAATGGSAWVLNARGIQATSVGAVAGYIEGYGPVPSDGVIRFKVPQPRYKNESVFRRHGR
jgi:hypothetical protein